MTDHRPPQSLLDALGAAQRGMVKRLQSGELVAVCLRHDRTWPCPQCLNETKAPPQ